MIYLKIEAHIGIVEKDDVRFMYGNRITKSRGDRTIGKDYW